MSGALPNNVVSSNGVGVVSDSQANTYLQTDQNVAQLRNFVGLAGMAVLIQGTTAPGDGGAGLFYWNPGTYSDEGVNVIVPYPAAGQGAWLRAPLNSAITASAFANLNLSNLPTSDPGGGRPWLNGNVLSVGSVTS